MAKKDCDCTTGRLFLLCVTMIGLVLVYFGGSSAVASPVVYAVTVWCS